MSQFRNDGQDKVVTFPQEVKVQSIKLNYSKVKKVGLRVEAGKGEITQVNKGGIIFDIRPIVTSKPTFFTLDSNKFINTKLYKINHFSYTNIVIH